MFGLLQNLNAFGLLELLFLADLLLYIVGKLHRWTPLHWDTCRVLPFRQTEDSILAIDQVLIKKYQSDKLKFIHPHQNLIIRRWLRSSKPLHFPLTDLCFFEHRFWLLLIQFWFDLLSFANLFSRVILQHQHKASHLDSLTSVGLLAPFQFLDETMLIHFLGQKVHLLNL